MTFKMKPTGQGAVMGSLGRGNRHAKARGPERMWLFKQ